MSLRSAAEDTICNTTGTKQCVDGSSALKCVPLLCARATLLAEVTRTEKKFKILRDCVQGIADQMTSEAVESEFGGGDFEAGYDACISQCKQALEEADKT